ncbi:MAG: photosynthetic reaction center cytochrome c subunit family protein [Vicinamibacterales bacterium]
MKLGVKSTALSVIAAVFVGVLSVAIVNGQTGAPERAPLSEEVFKNVQVMKGIPVDQFMATMGFFSASLGMSCGDCHAADDRNWDGFAVDNPRKRTTRRMITMMAAINKDNFGGRQVVTCFSCHRGADRPRATADLAVLYGTFPAPDPNEIFAASAPGAPTADSVLNKYIQALGGAQRLAALTSYTAVGQSVGYGPEAAEMRAVEFYVKAPAQRTLIIHTGNGDNTSVYNGSRAWSAVPLAPVPVLPLDKQELDGAKLDAMMAFPGQIKQVAGSWRVGFSSTIDDRDVEVVQGTTPGGTTATFYFDKQTGLLTRWIRYANSPVGRLSTQTDLSDYRDVAGVKIPYHMVVTWLDGRETIDFSSVRPNVPVDAAKFARPTPPIAPAR